MSGRFFSLESAKVLIPLGLLVRDPAGGRQNIGNKDLAGKIFLDKDLGACLRRVEAPILPLAR